MEVIEGNMIIQNGPDLFDFAKKNNEDLVPSRHQPENITLKRHIFFSPTRLTRTGLTGSLPRSEETEALHCILLSDESNSLVVCRVMETTALTVTTMNVKTWCTWIIEWRIEIEPARGYGHQQATRADIKEQQKGIKVLVTKDTGILLHKASREFKETYFVMYSILECFMCQQLYKCVPGFRLHESQGTLRF